MAGSEATTAPRRSGAHVPSGTRLVSLWLAVDLIEAARAAYLFDFYADPANNPFTWVSWVGRCLDTHNASTVDERAEHSYTRDTRATCRSFELPVATLDAVHQAIASETESQGHFVAVSHYAAAAIHRGVESARQRAGGPLPAAPTRLPDLQPIARRHRDAESRRQELRLRRHLVTAQANAIVEQLHSDAWVNLGNESLATLTARRNLLRRTEQVLASVAASLDVTA